MTGCKKDMLSSVHILGKVSMDNKWGAFKSVSMTHRKPMQNGAMNVYHAPKHALHHDWGNGH